MSAKVWVLAGITVGAALATAACFGSGSDEADQAPSEVNERAMTLNAVVALEGGCTAVKVGPKQLLVAARCVANRPQYAIGKPLKFRKGNVTLDVERQRPAPAADAQVEEAAAPVDASQPQQPPSDAGADAADAAVAVNDAGPGPVANADAGTDAGGPVAAAGDLYEETIAKVEIHPSFLAKCGTGACLPGKPGSAEVADVALIVVSREIVDLAIAPIDLDYVVPNDDVLVVSNGCDTAPTATPKLRAHATKAAALDAVVHDGSPYQQNAELRAALGRSYVVTKGPAGQGNPRDLLGVCSEKDLGAPLFRGDGSAIVGVNANYTVGPQPRGPVTNQHARVDLASQHNVGKWLEQLGAKTLKSCSTGDGGCPPLPDGGEAPKTDAGLEPDAALEPAPPTGEEPPPGEGNYPSESSSGDDGTDTTKPAAKKKKAASDGGCSASPYSSTSSTNAGLVAIALLGLCAAGRRRSGEAGRRSSDHRSRSRIGR